jgi:glutathione synthase/RimK-type ligase-like ATP-grasp enzyme
MKAFGIITLNLTSENEYFTEIAKRSPQYEMECYRFMPSNIHPVSHTVSGEKYSHETGNWAACEFPIPSILYDRCFYGEDSVSKTSKAIVKWLRQREDLSFLGYGLPNKWTLYQALDLSPLKSYLIDTKKPETPGQVLRLLHEKKRIILKPAFGSGGMGTVALEKQNDAISVRIEKQQEITASAFPEKQTALNWIHTLLSKREYLAQPFLDLKDHDRRPFDIRILLQKNGCGDWIERGKGIRAGRQDGILSNLRTGGEILPFSYWLDRLRPDEQAYILEELRDIATRLPVILEKEFPPLFEIGVDIGISKDHALWILDVNSKPGRKVVLKDRLEMKEELYSAPLEYGQMLLKNSEKGRDTREKTLSD